jgi:L-lysine 2,3-aminomutase
MSNDQVQDEQAQRIADLERKMLIVIENQNILGKGMKDTQALLRRLIEELQRERNSRDDNLN